MVVFKDSAREFVLLALSNALLSSLHSSSFSSLTSSSLSSRERRASSLDFVAHTGAPQQNRARKFVFPLRFVSVRFENEKKYTDEDNDGDENEDEEKEHLRRRRGRWKRRERDDADDARKQR